MMANGSALDLLLSSEAKLFNLGHPQITCCTHEFRCNRLIYCHKVLEGNAMNCEEGGTLSSKGFDIIDQTI
jgi:hypothetical protein